jgi:hypothetical protein
VFFCKLGLSFCLVYYMENIHSFQSSWEGGPLTQFEVEVSGAHICCKG